MQLDIDAQMRRLFRRMPRLSIYAVARALLIAALIVQLARLTWLVLTPNGALGDWTRREPVSRETAQAILTNFDPFFRLDGAAPASSAVVTSLQLTLFGIRIDEAMGRGSAIIATPDGQQKSYTVGDEIMPGVKLKEVAFDHVTIERGGASEDLFIDQSRAVTPVAPDGALPGPAATAPRDNGVAIADIRAGIGFIPRIDGGRVTGLVVRPQGGSDVFQRIGFRPGDVVTQINGRPVGGTADIDSMSAGGNMTLSVERGTENLPLVVDVKGK
jgi:general secretion pathway protein C